MEERIAVGGFAGLVGGLLSGLFLQEMWAASPLGVLMGQAAARSDWMTHLVLALIFGMLFGALLHRFSTSATVCILLGGLSGAIFYIAAYYLRFVVTYQWLQELSGYMILGAITGLTYYITMHKLPEWRG